STAGELPAPPLGESCPLQARKQKPPGPAGPGGFALLSTAAARLSGRRKLGGRRSSGVISAQAAKGTSCRLSAEFHETLDGRRGDGVVLPPRFRARCQPRDSGVEAPGATPRHRLRRHVQAPSNF